MAHDRSHRAHQGRQSTRARGLLSSVGNRVERKSKEEAHDALRGPRVFANGGHTLRKASLANAAKMVNLPKAPESSNRAATATFSPPNRLSSSGCTEVRFEEAWWSREKHLPILTHVARESTLNSRC